MSQKPTRSLGITIAVAALLCAGPALFAAASLDDAPKPKDEALSKLLEKLNGTGTDAPKGEDAQAKPSSTGADDSPKSDTPAPAKPSGDVAPKDKALDSLLEKLGETKDAPAPDDRRGGPGGPPTPGEKPPGDKPEKTDPNSLTGKSKALDEHLEELTGKRKKKNDQQPGEGSGPLAKVIKEMREVEERLGKPDTGEETRKKQQEIVKNLDTLIQQMRKSQSQSKGKKRRQIAMKPGQQPGDENEDPGDNPAGVGAQKPMKPTTKHSLAGGKDIWGHLPEELRQEMDNVFKEESLEKKKELIDRYYLSVSKKALNRARGN
jgi:hypothetical protein